MTQWVNDSIVNDPVAPAPGTDPTDLKTRGMYRDEARARVSSVCFPVSYYLD